MISLTGGEKKEGQIKKIRIRHPVDGTSRAEKKSGLKDWIVLKQDQRCGKLIEGIVKDILTKSPSIPMACIKVRLEIGLVDRVKNIVLVY